MSHITYSASRSGWISRMFLAVLVLGALPLASAVAADAKPLEALLSKGDAYDGQLKTREALATFLEAEKLEPANAEVLWRVAKQYAEMMADTASSAEKRALGDKALGYAERAVAANPGSADVQLTVAICYGRLAPLLDNKTKIAYSKLVKEHVDRALQLDPKNDYAQHVLGAWNYELSNLNPLLRVIAGAIYGTLPSASNERAVECFKKAIALAPQRVSHHVELGRSYAALGQTELARTELNKGLSLPSKEKDDEETKERARAALKKL